MADSKVSGLSVVAAFADTQEFLVNDSGTSRKITGALLRAALPQGTLSSGYAQIVADQGSITTVVDIAGLSVTVTVVAGRRIRVTAGFNVTSTVATDGMEVGIWESGSQLHFTRVALNTSGQVVGGLDSVILQPSTGSHTYNVRCLRSNGSGTVTFKASAVSPAYILVEDIGI